jgi:hypothetical protein
VVSANDEQPAHVQLFRHEPDHFADAFGVERSGLYYGFTFFCVLDLVIPGTIVNGALRGVGADVKSHCGCVGVYQAGLDFSI